MVNTKPWALIFLIVSILVLNINAQESHSLYQNHSFRMYDKFVYTTDSNFHTSIKPYLNYQINRVLTIDSVNKKPVTKKWQDILFNRSLVQYEKKDFKFTIDPLLNFEVAKDKDSSNTSYINTRGIMLNAQLGTSVSVSTSFYENQARFNDYRNARIEKIGGRIVPGQGSGKAFGDSLPQTYDFGFAEGYVSFTPNQHFNVTFGHGKNFIGDGYRSLILSDNTFNYPYLRINTDFWHIKYVNLWAQFQDTRQKTVFESPYAKKWAAMHFLDWNVTPWLNVGFFEAIVWQNADSTGVRGFDINYANPVIFLRPVEFSVGSPDNSLMGINGKLTLFKNQIFYGQAIIDEFKLSELIAQNGWWANKYGFQTGYKTFDLFGLQNLNLQTEFNYVRPFMYTHNSTLQNYAHFNQPLAHPMGANFWESVSFIRYHKNRFYFEGRFSYALHGSDTANMNFGNDIYQDYETHAKEYDNYLGQTQEVHLTYAKAQIAYLVNSRTNLNLYLNYTYRKETIATKNTIQGLITLGIRTSLQNFYYDF